MLTKYFFSLALGLAAALPADKVKPCKLNDLACIGKYLSKYSKCDSKNLDKAPIDPYNIKHVHLETPGFNSSEDRSNVVLTGLNSGSVQNFFINKKTNKAVLSLVFETLAHKSDVRVNYYRPGDEPLTVDSEDIGDSFTNIIFTVVFDSATNLELKDASIYTYFGGELNYDFGDGAILKAAQKNPLIAQVVNKVQNDSTVAALETLFYRSVFPTTLFINRNICHYKEGAQVPDVN